MKSTFYFILEALYIVKTIFGYGENNLIEKPR